MNIVDEIFSEDCFDGNFIKEYTVDKTLKEDWINYLKQLGTMTYLDNLEQPFYSFDKKYFFTIKGLLNENKIKVIFRRNNMEKTMDFLHILLEYFEKDKNIEVLKEKEKNILENIEK